jgi:hypothetical protein
MRVLREFRHPVSPTRDVLPPEEELVQTPFYRIFASL